MSATSSEPREQRKEIHEVVGVFDTLDTVQSAIDDLLSDGFDRSEISLLGEDDAVRARNASGRVI
ncbi:MAG TPA: general stress protein, partial [Methylocystis sp.]|nr:general stress protein [Methylocystis sp.]